jgi:hypothetical protein
MHIAKSHLRMIQGYTKMATSSFVLRDASKGPVEIARRRPNLSRSNGERYSTLDEAFSKQRMNHDARSFIEASNELQAVCT